jgi:hypothetical protein
MTTIISTAAKDRAATLQKAGFTKVKNYFKANFNGNKFAISEYGLHMMDQDEWADYLCAVTNAFAKSDATPKVEALSDSGLTFEQEQASEILTRYLNWCDDNAMYPSQLNIPDYLKSL